MILNDSIPSKILFELLATVDPVLNSEVSAIQQLC